MLKELKWVYDKFEFNKSCPAEVKQEMLTKGLVQDIEGTYVVSDAGEELLGIAVPDADDLDDITECYIGD